MAGTRQSNDWGFPRWRGYGYSRETREVRICDREGCNEPGDRPAPKSPNRSERWYFEGLTKEQRERRARAEKCDASAYSKASHYGWSGPGDGTRSADEMRALELFELDSDADLATVRKAWRKLAKENHPDVKPGDAEAAKRFVASRAAWEVLRAAEERRSWKGR